MTILASPVCAAPHVLPPDVFAVLDAPDRTLAMVHLVYDLLVWLDMLMAHGAR
jgi:hypothetical protein